MIRRSTVALVAALLAVPTLVLTVAPPARATSPGTSGRIAFASSIGGTNEIFTSNADGSGLRNLTNNAGNDSSAVWSPDGSKLAFISNRAGSGLYAMNADGSGAHKVASPSVLTGFGLAWTPDASRLTFVAGPNGDPDIFTIKLDGTDQKPLISGSSFDLFPAWSPDGSRIVFQRHDATPTSSGLWIADADGTNQVQLTIGTGDENPSFSPDGKTIVFDRQVGNEYQLYTIKPDGTGLTPLSEIGPREHAPKFSPDGTQLTFQTASSASGPFSVAVMNTDGSGRHLLRTPSDFWMQPDWQPIPTPKPPFNGKIVFSTLRDNNWEVYSVDPDGAAPTNLTNDPAIDWWPVASPDGSKIAFGSTRTSPPGLYVMNADGTNVHLVASPGGGFGTSWSGDGTKIAYVAPHPGDNSTADIWTVNADGTNATDVISGGQNRFPSFSADGTKIVWDKTGTPEAGLWVADANGSNGSRLTDDSTGIDQKASFAPDGKTIIFNRTAPAPNSNSSSELWTMDADGSAQTQLTNFTGYNAWPRYSPDGRQVVFQQSSDSDGPFDLAVMNADGSAVRTLAANQADDEFPDWQPLASPVVPGAPTQVAATAGHGWAAVSWTQPLYDGGVAVTGYTVTASPGGAVVTVPADETSAIVHGLTNRTPYTFTVKATNSAGTGSPSAPSNTVTPFALHNGKVAFASTRAGTSQIFLADPDGSDVSELTHEANGATMPAWSSDGTQIAFAVSGPAPAGGVFVMNADGTNKDRVTDAGIFLEWSPDGTRFALMRQINSAAHIVTVKVDGTDERDLGTGVGPAWTADGRQIVFRNMNSGLWTMNADGSNRTPLSDGTLNGTEPDVSPDGTKIAFSALHGNQTDIFVMGIDGSAVTQLTNTSAADDWPDWSPDGTQIVFQTAGASNTDLKVMNADGSDVRDMASSASDDGPADWQPVSRDVSGEYFPLTPARILDTRTGAPIGNGQSIDVSAAGQGGVPATGVSAVVLNITVTQPTVASYLTAWPTGQARPTASNLNYAPGQTVPNLVVVKLGAGGKFSLFNNAGTTHAIVDVVGWYSDGTTDAGARYTGLTPARILDTRSGSPIGQGASIDVPAAGQGGVPASGVSAVVVNLTATDPTAASYLTAWPTGQGRPTASNLNYVPGQTVPNLAVVKVGAGGKFSLYNNAGSTHVIADVVGWYSDGLTGAGSAFVPVTPFRLLDSRQAHVPIGQDASIDVLAAGVGGIPANGTSAVVLNVTATEPTSASYLTAWPTGAARPTASNLNYTPGQTVPNLVVVKLGPTGRFSLYNHSGSTHVIVDVVGWFAG